MFIAKYLFCFCLLNIAENRTPLTVFFKIAFLGQEKDFSY